jgi:23S rRNA 5-hydroxycytidine C2501 synthase
VQQEFFRMEGDRVSNGDGLCFFTPLGALSGFRVNRVQDDRIYPNTMRGLAKGGRVYRNHDRKFFKILDKASAVRRIGISLRFDQSQSRISLEAIDEDGNQAKADMDIAYQAPRDPELALNQTTGQLSSTGNTIYEVRQIFLHPSQPGFLSFGVLNRLRREVLNELTKVRLNRYQPKAVPFCPNPVAYPEKSVDYRVNVLNRRAEQFYIRHGATVSESAIERVGDPLDKIIMTTRYCICHKLGACSRYANNAISLKKPLQLTDGHRHYRLSFDCHRCVMHIHQESLVSTAP